MDQFLRITISDQIFDKLAKLLLVIGGMTRIFIYFQNRSLFLDEANLARNVVEKDPIDFFSWLDYEQYAPPFFLLVQKLSTTLLGATEYAVRLFPLIAALISLYLFYKLAIRVLCMGPGLIFIVFIFCFGEYFLHFGTEGKQYASDIMMALLFLVLALKTPEGVTWRSFLYWTLGGMLAIWFSMSIVFILAGVGIYFFVRLFPDVNRDELYRLLGAILLWIASFAVYYFTILKSDVDSKYLQDFHDPYFLPLFPTSFSELGQAFSLILSIVKTGVGHTFIAALFGTVTFITGVIKLFRENRNKSILLLTPVLTTLFAAALHQYSLIPRLTLFFIPIVLIIIGVGINWMFRSWNNWGKSIVLILMISIMPLHDGIKYLWQPYQIEEIRLVLTEVKKEMKAEDVLYINHQAYPAYNFYTEHYKNRSEFQFSRAFKGDWKLNPDLSSLKSEEKAINRIWLVYSHLISEAALRDKNKEMEVFLKHYESVREINFKGASAVLLKKIN